MFQYQWCLYFPKILVPMVLMWCLSFAIFFDIMVLILQKILTLMDSLFFEKNLIVPVVIWAISFTKNLVVLNLSTFAIWALKVQKFYGAYFLKVQYQWCLISQISSTGAYMGGAYKTRLRVVAGSFNILSDCHNSDVINSLLNAFRLNFKNLQLLCYFFVCLF